MDPIETVIRELRSQLSESLVLTDASSLSFYGRDWLKDFSPAPSAIVFPESIQHVQAIVQTCLTHRVAIVPSGGRTGLSGGAAATNGEIVVSMERMRSILEVNRIDRTIRCQAGVVLEQLQIAATEAGLYFPVDFSSRGSAQIGGNIATNAGGIRVIKYGNFRDWVVGLVVVTGTGEVLRLNGSLFKNNSGYDLRNLFVGSEGTLGIIVEATVKLTSPPGDVTRVLCGLSSANAILPLLTFCRDRLPSLSAFEFMERFPFQEVIWHRGARDPLAQPYEAYALVECELASAEGMERVVSTFGEAYETGLIQDVVVSESSAQAHELMNLRDLISETLSQRYTLHKNDISVPVPAIPAFIEELHNTVRAIYPDFKVAVFGHVGDGNLHVNILNTSKMNDEEFWKACHESDHRVFEIVQSYQGSISAEHGVGLLKRDFLRYTRSPAEIAIMRGIKGVLDPHSIMNPGKVLGSLV